VLHGASRRLGRRVTNLRELGKQSVLALPLEEQYLVATGRTYFRNLSFDQLRRMQFDLETTGLDPARDRIFLIAVRNPSGVAETLEAYGDGAAAEADLIRRLIAMIQAADPDVIENHNLHGFDLPFLNRRAQILGVPLALGRIGLPGLRQRAARRGFASGPDLSRWAY
jgi:DNA polymerase I